MTYNCEIIKDLLPLYIDGVCSTESVQMIEKHLSECESCRKCYEEMKEATVFTTKENNSLENEKMADSLKKVKTKINKKIRNIAICTVSAALVFTVGFQVIFNAPIKSVDKDKVKVTAEVYPFSELPHSIEANDDSIEISFDENDNSDVYRVEIPEMGDVSISEDVMKRDKYATVITAYSDYFLRSINWEIKDDTIYISSFKTTILNNKAENHQKTMKSIEFRKINKIVYTDGKTETILWER